MQMKFVQLGENGVPFGNYGQTLFIWDQLFGTATFMDDKVPEIYGTIAADESKWHQQLWWPLFRLPKAKPTSDAPEKPMWERGCC